MADGRPGSFGAVVAGGMGKETTLSASQPTPGGDPGQPELETAALAGQPDSSGLRRIG